MVGDVSAERVFALAQTHFGDIASRPTPAPPDVAEAANTEPRRLDQRDPLAQVPALAVGWKMPPAGSPDHLPLAVAAEVLAGGEASRLYLGLVKGRELLLGLEGGMNWPLGGPFDFDGPVLLTLFAPYKPTTTADDVIAAIEEEVARIATEGISAAELARVKTQMLSGWYGGGFHGGIEGFMWRADAIAKAAALKGDANAINEVPSQIEAVTPEALQRAVRTWLVPGNRSAIDRQPAPPEAAPTAKGEVTP